MGRQGREGHRRDPGVAVLGVGGIGAVRRDRPGRHLGRLPRHLVEPRHVSAEPGAEHGVRRARLRDHVVALVAAHRMPVALVDHAVGAAAPEFHAAVVLLAAVDAVGKAVVHRQVVELSGGLVVPARPALPPVHRDRGALVSPLDHVRSVARVDPEEVVVVAPRRSLEEAEGLAAIRGTPDRLAGHVHGLRIVGVHGEPAEVAAGQYGVAVRELPMGAAVVGAVEPARVVRGRRRGERRSFDCHRRIDDRPAAARRHREPDAPQVRRRQPLGEAVPVDAAVGALVDAGSRPRLGHEVVQPRVNAHLPHGGVHHRGVGGIPGEIHGPGRIVHVQLLLPMLAAVGRQVHAALGVGAEHVPHRGHQHPIRIVRIHQNAPDVVGGLEPDVGPRIPGIVRPVDSVAGGNVVARSDLSGSDVDDVGIGRGDGQGAHGRRGLMLHQPLPGASGIGGLPDPAARRPEVEGVRFAGHSFGDRRPAGAEGTDESPVQFLKGARRHIRRRTALQRRPRLRSEHEQEGGGGRDFGHLGCLQRVVQRKRSHELNATAAKLQPGGHPARRPPLGGPAAWAPDLPENLLVSFDPGAPQIAGMQAPTARFGRVRRPEPIALCSLSGAGTEPGVIEG